MEGRVRERLREEQGGVSPACGVDARGLAGLEQACQMAADQGDRDAVALPAGEGEGVLGGSAGELERQVVASAVERRRPRGGRPEPAPSPAA